MQGLLGNQEEAGNSVMDKKTAIQLIWNNMNPLSRKPLIERTFRTANSDTLEFYKSLDLDSRVEFLCGKSEKFKQQFWSMGDGPGDEALKLELQVLESENLHH